METPRDPKFIPKGQVKTINGSITFTNTGSLALIPVALGVDGKPDSKLYGVLGKRWTKTIPEAKGWYQSQFNFKLGSVRDLAVQSDAWIMHMLCIDKDGKVNDKALATCFKSLLATAKYEKASVHVSSHLVEQIPQVGKYLQKLIDDSVSVFIYNEPSPPEVK